jgi:Predicted S-adenosylmethionine-dependent methyltransferase
MYQQFLKPGGLIHLKTDSPDLYQFTKLVCQLYGCNVFEDFDDLKNQSAISDELKIETHYEKLDISQSNRIHYISFSLPTIIAGKEKDEELKLILNGNQESATH